MVEMRSMPDVRLSWRMVLGGIDSVRCSRFALLVLLYTPPRAFRFTAGRRTTTRATQRGAPRAAARGHDPGAAPRA